MRFCLLLLSLVLVGCSSTPPPTNVPYVVNTEIIIGNTVNPYAQVPFHPIVLRVYQLQEKGSFVNAEFLDLYNDDRNVLGASMIDALYLDPMLPGDHQLEIDLQREARYIAVMAEFADYTNAKSKAVLKLIATPDTQVVSIRVNGLSVEISQRAKIVKSWWQF